MSLKETLREVAPSSGGGRVIDPVKESTSLPTQVPAFYSLVLGVFRIQVCFHYRFIMCVNRPFEPHDIKNLAHDGALNFRSFEGKTRLKHAVWLPEILEFLAAEHISVPPLSQGAFKARYCVKALSPKTDKAPQTIRFSYSSAKLSNTLIAEVL